MAMRSVVSRSWGSWSTPEIEGLHSDTMVLSSQLLKLLQELVLSAEKSQMTAPGQPLLSELARWSVWASWSWTEVGL